MGDLGARLADAAQRGSSRRGFLARVGKTLLAASATGAGAELLRAEQAAAGGGYTNFCGHTFTTGNCPHPTGLPRVDAHGYPLRARDGRAVDDLGRPIDHDGYPVDAHGHRLLDAAGAPLAPAPRSRICLDVIPERYGLRTHLDGTWHRCCGGHVRRLVDCCAHTSHRINGDAALTGYCYHGRSVFCVLYYQTKIPC